MNNTVSSQIYFGCLSYVDGPYEDTLGIFENIGELFGLQQLNQTEELIQQAASIYNLLKNNLTEVVNSFRRLP